MSGMNLALTQIAAWLPQAKLVGDGAQCVQRVHTDTRSLQAGDLFVALKGERFNAADFIGAAAQQGAAAVLCDASAAEQLAASGLPGLLVPDALRAPLARLLKRAAPRLKVLAHSEIPETHSIRIGSIIGASA